jgi:hypothetical protein
VDGIHPEVASVHLLLAHVSPQMGPAGGRDNALESGEPQKALASCSGRSGLASSCSQKDIWGLFSWLASQVGETDFLVWLGHSLDIYVTDSTLSFVSCFIFAKFVRGLKLDMFRLLMQVIKSNEK